MIRNAVCHGNITANRDNYLVYIMMLLINIIYYARQMSGIQQTFGLWILQMLWSISHAATVETCTATTLQINCQEGELIIIKKAELGRMETGTCIHSNRYIGCTNDIRYLLDEICSGKGSCQSNVPSPEMKKANTECEDFLEMYLRTEYTCVKVSQATCNQETEAEFTQNEGIISSHMTGCGSTRSRLTISAMSGQSIALSVIDFGSDVYRRYVNRTTELPLYAYIKDGVHTVELRGSTERERDFYKSKTNKLIITMTKSDDFNGFLIKFKKLGCPDLSPPAHAWYKRDEDQAVIGCEWSQKTWHLSCDGHSWSGVVGNCSEPVTAATPTVEKQVEISSALWLVCVVSVSVVLMVIACVIGIVCIKKYRIKHDVQKSMTLQMVPGQGHYDLDPNIEMASMLYLPYKISDEQQQQQQGTLSDPHRPTSYLIPQDQVVNELTPIRIWERPLPDLPDKPLASSGTVRSGRTPGDGDEAVDNQEGSTIQSQRSDMSTTELKPGQKYSALTQQIV